MSLWPQQAGSAPEHQGTEASKSPQPKPREEQEQKASKGRRKKADGSSRCSCPSIPGEVRGASPPSSGGWHPRRPEEAARAPLGDWFQPAEHQPGPSSRAATPALPSGLPAWERSQRSWSERAGVGPVQPAGAGSPRSWGGCTSRSGQCPAGS